MKRKKKSTRVYERRRMIASIYTFMSIAIGFPMAIIGAKPDSNSDNANMTLYVIGLVISGTGLILLSLFSEFINKMRDKEIYKEEFINE